MVLSAIAWTAVILVVVFLSLTFAPNWSLAILILVGNIAQEFDNIRKKTAEPSPGGGPGGGPGGDLDADQQAPQDNATATHDPADFVPAQSHDSTSSDDPADLEDPDTAQSHDSTSSDDPADLEDPDPAQSYYSTSSGDSADDAPAAAGEAAGRTRREPKLSSTSSSSYAFKYDVYLNFRGRHGITAHLCHALKAEGISVLKDDHSIGEISPKVIEDIKWSRISIAILSKDYASSKWCLTELVEMWKCRESNGQIIIPIFYEVSRSDVRHLAGNFGRSFSYQHVKGEVGSDTIETWKKVLRQIGRLRGFSPRDLNGKERELVKRVVAHVAQLLKRDDQVVTDKLVGIHLHVQEMMRKLGVAYGEGQVVEVRGGEVRVVGIWGVPGVGKTTLAKVVFDKMRKSYDASSFLEDISLKGVPFSRRLLITDLLKQKSAPLESSSEGIEEIASLCCNAKVLIVLDDVNEDEQIRALAGKLTWFGPGSRIIVTTNNRDVLRAFNDGAYDRRTVKEYEVESMYRGAPPPPGDALASIGKKGRDAVSSSTPSSLSGIKYEVFLNFRGTDTPTIITDHLFKALVDVGISVFKEDEELHGEEALAEAIKQSRVWIVILSTDYALSERCLLKLEQMWEWRKSNKQVIIPIFYNVSPSDVRDQAGDFGKAFSLHEKRAELGRIKKWREVLRGIADLRGYSGKLYERFEGQLVQEVVLLVARILRDHGLAVTDKLFGIHLHVQGMMRKLGVAPSEGRETKEHGEDVRVIGIYGMPGVGKTTLAKVIYNKVPKLFEAYSFLEGISAKGVRVSQQLLIADLLKQEPAPLESVDEGVGKIANLFRNKKVFIVLDDVDGDEQIKALAGKLMWFGSGSRIIVTTRNRQVLSDFDDGANGCGTVAHEIKLMSDDHAFQLFRYHAFQGHALEEQLFRDNAFKGDAIREYSERKRISKAIVKALRGVPKDIVHHASDLGLNRPIQFWRNKLTDIAGTQGDRRAAQVSYAGGSELKKSIEDKQRIITEDMD